MKPQAASLSQIPILRLTAVSQLCSDERYFSDPIRSLERRGSVETYTRPISEQGMYHHGTPVHPDSSDSDAEVSNGQYSMCVTMVTLNKEIKVPYVWVPSRSTQHLTLHA